MRIRQTDIDRVELAFVDVLLGRHPMTCGQALRMLRNRRTAVFLAIVLVILFASDPPRLMNHMPAWKAALIWPVALAIYLPLFFGQVILAAALTPQGTRRRIYTPLACAVALLPTIYLSETLAAVLSTTDYDMRIADKFVFFLVAVQAFELIFLRFVLPLLELETVKAPQPPETESPMLTLAGEKLRVTSIVHVEARQHFVRIRTEDGIVQRRARLSDVLAQLDGADGIQPHRSWWIARRAGPALETRNDKPVLLLTDGTTVPVARGRVDSVRDWLKERLAAE